jgi:hypothetical protein
MRTTVGKTGYAEFLKTSEGKALLFEDEMAMIVKMAESAGKNETFLELIKDGYRELSCYTTDIVTGLKIKMRPDSIATNKSTITDIKSCVDASFRGFKSNVYSYGYSTTASFYSDFLKRENYVFCAIEKTAPHQTALYMLDEEMLEYGRKQYRTGLDLLKWCIDNNYYPDYCEFEILKNCYELGSLNEFFDIKNKSEKITILR